MLAATIGVMIPMLMVRKRWPRPGHGLVGDDHRLH